MYIVTSNTYLVMSMLATIYVAMHIYKAWVVELESMHRIQCYIIMLEILSTCKCIVGCMVDVHQYLYAYASVAYTISTT